MKSNIREIIRYIDDTTLEKSNEEKKDEQEAESTMSEKVQEFVNLTITEHTGKAYSEWKLNQDKEAVSEIDKIPEITGNVIPRTGRSDYGIL